MVETRGGRSLYARPRRTRVSQTLGANKWCHDKMRKRELGKSAQTTM